MSTEEDFYNDKKVLITGGAGAIGSRLTRLLLKYNCSIIIIDNLSSGYKWNIPNSKKILFIKGDITNNVDLKRVFNEKPDIIFHLAAFFANQNSVDYPELDLRTNGLGILKLLEFCTIYSNIDRFVYASSGSSIYPSDTKKLLKEDQMTLKLNTPYQITKMLGELYCNYYYRIKSIPITIARIFNSYGPGEVPGQYRNVIPNFIYWSKHNIDLPITGTGKETRTFTYIDDICRGLAKIGFVDKAVGESINLASGREITIQYLAETIIKTVGNNNTIKYYNPRDWDKKKRILASNEKAKRVLNFYPEVDFETGIRKTIEWFNNNWEIINKNSDFPPGLSSAVRNPKN